MNTENRGSSKSNAQGLASRKRAQTAADAIWCDTFVEAIKDQGDVLLATWCGPAGWYGRARDMWCDLHSIVDMPFISRSFAKRNKTIARCMKQCQDDLAAIGWHLAWDNQGDDLAMFYLKHLAFDPEAAAMPVADAIIASDEAILVDGV